jgi:hypothetical protein
MSPFDKIKADLIIPLIKNNSSASDSEIFRLAVRHFEANRSSRDLCYEYIIKNILASVERVKPQGENSIAVLPRERVTAPVPGPVRADVEHRVSALTTRRDIVAEVRRVAPTAPATIQKKIVAEVEKQFERPLVRASIATEAVQHIPAVTRVLPAHREQAVTTAVAKAVAVEVPKAIVKIDRVEQMKVEAIACVLLDYVLPDGTPVREATFGALAKLGGWATAVSKLGPANAKVGGLRGVDEQTLQNIMLRFTDETTAPKARVA